MIKIAVKVAPVYEELNVVHKSGVRYVELYTDKKFISDKCADAAVRAKEDFGFEYVVHAPTDLDDSMIDQTVKFAAKVGAKTIMMHKTLDFDGIRRIVEFAKSKGILVCIENGGMYKMQSIEEFLELHDKISDIRVGLDTEHSVMFKTHPKAFELAGDLIKHIHITGSPPGFHKPLSNNPKLVEEMVGWIKKIGYGGFLVVEMDKEYQTLDNFKAGKEMLERLL